jgi:hypothetical protein
MHRSTAWSSASATSLRSLSSAAFITVTAESNFRYTHVSRGWGCHAREHHIVVAETEERAERLATFHARPNIADCGVEIAL